MPDDTIRIKRGLYCSYSLGDIVYVYKYGGEFYAHHFDRKIHIITPTAMVFHQYYDYIGEV